MITELGRLTSETELKKVMNGDKEISVFNNRIAIYQGKDKTTYIDITAWGKIAEFVAEHFQKGDEIYIEGELHNKPYKVGDKIVNVHFIKVVSVRLVFGKPLKIGG